MENTKQNNRHVYWNPYFGGFLLGLLIIFTFYITGRGLGASGAIKRSVAAVVHEVAPEHAENTEYLAKYYGDEGSPLNAWLVFEILGMIAGGFIAGAMGGRLKWTIEKNPLRRNTVSFCRCRSHRR